MTVLTTQEQLDLLIVNLTNGAESIRMSLGKEDDWEAVAMYFDRDHTVHHVLAYQVAIPELRADAIAALQQQLKDDGATCAGMIATMWGVSDVSPEELQRIMDGRSPRASQHPNRHEELTIFGVARGGLMKSRRSLITRPANYSRPRLGFWHDIPANGEISGDIVEAFRAGVEP